MHVGENCLCPDCHHYRNPSRHDAFQGRAAEVIGHLEDFMDGIIYLIGLIVVILAILSFFGLR